MEMAILQIGEGLKKKSQGTNSLIFMNNSS
jgi:hypothetical protein